MKWLWPTESVGLGSITSFVIKGYSEKFVPVLKFISNLSLSQNSFPKLWKQSATLPVFKKQKHSSVGNYRPITILSNISEVFEFVILDHISHILKSKLNLSQHGFMKYKSTVINLVTCLDFLTPLACSQGQSDCVFWFQQCFRHSSTYTASSQTQ